MSEEKGKIESLSHENRVFAPREAMKKGAAIPSMTDYLKMQSQAEANLEDFWSVQASEHLKWKKTWTKVLDWKPPRAKWFVGGEINVSENCLDRHLGTPRENKPAIIWVGEPEGEKLTLTYKELHARVCKFANGLKKLGVQKGDRVALYMPMTPEAAIGMLACARIGAIHSVVFGGFSSESLKDRIHDAEVKFVLTADGAWRGGKVIPLKATVDAALVEGTPVQKVVVLKRTKSEVTMKSGRDFWWSEVETTESADCPPEALESEHPLFILYTSGTTGKPKGIWHSSAGYLLGATLTSRWVFDLREEDIFWCTADVGWITGHSYVVYGPLSNGATTVMYEGGPMYPNPDRFWSIIDELKVTTFYTAPTAIRAFMKQGDEWVEKHKLNSLRLLGTVGEPINPEAWMWYHKKIGHEKCPIVDTWWQTETGSIMLSPLPAATPTKPGSATFPLPGIFPRIVDENGKTVEAGGGGYLVIDKPWPSMLRGVWGDEERFKKTYFEKFPGIYFTGDGAQQDKDGYFWIMGRVDDVINVSGHRLGTAEIESALVSHHAVAEAAVVGIPHEVKGTGVVAFVTLKGGQTPSDSLNEELRTHVVKEIGAIAKPERIQFTDKLPKTRSGKIMRRLLRELAAGKEIKGDVTTLEDTGVLESLRQN